MVTIRDNKDYIRVLLYSYYTTITGWAVLLIFLSLQKSLVLHEDIEGRTGSGSGGVGLRGFQADLLP